MKSVTENLTVNSALRIISRIDLRKKINLILFVTQLKKCLKCERIITGKYVNIHKCGYRERTNCVKYVDKDHKCYLKKIKVKGGYCTVNKNNPCKINKSVKKKDWCFSCRSYTEKYLFYDFECTQDYNGNGNEYIHKNVD